MTQVAKLTWQRLRSWARLATAKSSSKKPKTRKWFLVLPQNGTRKCDEKAAQIAVAAVFQNEAEYLQEWIEFHLMVGVDHLYLYDNASSDQFKPIVNPYIRRGQVTLFPWATFAPHPQLVAYAHAIRNCAPTVRWLAFLDLDEFLFSEACHSIKTILAKFQNYAAIQIPRYEFGPSGHVEKPEGLVIENYSRVANRANTGRQKKSIVDPRLTTEVEIHKCIVSGETFTIADSCPTDLRINHYFSKSEAEFRRKLQRGYEWHRTQGDRTERINAKKLALFNKIQASNGSHYSMSRFAPDLKFRLASSLETSKNEESSGGRGI